MSGHPKQMTVANLRATLSGLPDDMPVCISYDAGCAYMHPEIALVADGKFWLGDDVSLRSDGALFPSTTSI